MLLSAQTIQKYAQTYGLVAPFCAKTVIHGMSYGLSSAGYDIRIKDDAHVWPGEFTLATTVESFNFPNHLLGMLVDKSSWARKGIAVQNTVFEPGWRGFPTIEISNHGHDLVVIPEGAPVAQMIFFKLDEPTDIPYVGKYQDQEQKPTEAIDEKNTI